MTGGLGGEGRAKGYGVSFRNDKNVLKLTVVTDAHIFECAKNHLIVYNVSR